jgi:glycosyltransferase involved in cell wall biosynthesis
MEVSETAPPQNAVSVIVPTLNEEGNVAPLIEELERALDGRCQSYEIIVVDDGSTDKTLSRLEDELETRSHVPLRVLQHRANFGQTAALATGFRAARAAVIVTLDGDLQNDPADIPGLLTHLRDGADVVCGWRRQRQEGPIRQIPSLLAARVVRWLTGLEVHDVGCTLRAYRREIVDDLDLWGEMHRFIPALCLAVGARIDEMEVAHRPRFKGETKYGRTGLRRMFRVLLDLVTLSVVTRYRGRPIRMYGWWAGGAALAAAATAATARFVGPDTGTIVGLCLLLAYAGVLLLGVGASAELAARSYAGAAARGPGYVRRELRSDGWEKQWDAARDGSVVGLTGSGRR